MPPADAAAPEALLEISGLEKSYGATKALAGVSFYARGGQILAVLGENGAGKSTLVKLLAGATRPDGGTITLDGIPLSLSSPREALKRGIVLIPQELAYVPDLSIAENIFLGRTANRYGLTHQRSLRARALPYLAQVGLDVDPARLVRSLTLGQQQLVEIAKALARDAKVLLLDEPTAALTAGETEALFGSLGRLRADGVISVLISHRLDEVRKNADDVLVLRDGHVASLGPIAFRTKADLIADMLGHELAAPTAKKMAAEDRLQALALIDVETGRDSGTVSLAVGAGQIVSLFGIRGAGHDGIVEMLAGLRPHQSGEVRLHGAQLAPLTSPLAAAKVGIAYVPSDRKKSGLVLQASIRRNIALPALRLLTRFGIVSPSRESRLVNRYLPMMSLKYRELSQPVRELSGGNQQKVLIGSRLALGATLLVLHEPTRGVDLGARRQIHDLIRQLAEENGTAVIVASTDVDEVAELSDTAHVFAGGQLVQTLEGISLTQDNLLLAAQSD